VTTFGIHVPSKSDAFKVQLIAAPELKAPYFGSSAPSGGVHTKYSAFELLAAFEIHAPSIYMT